MSEVKFSIKLIVDGKEQVADATADLSEFQESLRAAKDASTKLRDSLIGFNQVSQSFRDAFDGISNLSNQLGSLSSANRDNVEVLEKLRVNMHNMMDASDADVESIRRLCEAEQGLGVISDDIQLQGAQELATYLEKKSSLETLIPVMNDMVAQQYGFNASQEAAQNIATMLGKVMDGQVGALSRYGYKFDEVQEQILKFGTEEERAAVLADVVSSSVGGMNHALRSASGGVSELEVYLSKLKDWKGSKEEEEKLVAVLNGTYGETMGYFSSVSSWYDALTKNSEAYCRQLVNEARARQLSNEISSLDHELYAMRCDDRIADIYSNESVSDSSSEISKFLSDYNRKVSQKSLKEQLLSDLQKKPAELFVKGSTSAQSRSASKPLPSVMSTAGHSEYHFAEPGSLRWYELEIKKLSYRIRNISDESTVKELLKQRAALEESLKAKKIAVGLEEVELPASIEVPSLSDIPFEKGSGADKRLSYANAQSIGEGIQHDYEIGLIGYDTALEQVAALNLELEKLGLKPIEIPLMTDDVEKAEQKFKGAMDSIDAMGSSLSGLGDAIELPELNVAGTVAQAVAQVALSYSKALTEASSLGPWAWVAFAATGLAQMTAVIASIKDVAKFADGGIAYGPTLGLFGEYAGAGHNPEVVAPLDKLRGLLGVDGVGGGSGRVEMRVRGRDLVVAMANETRINRKRTKIRI